MADTELRGQELKVYKPYVHLDIRKYFFQSEWLMHGIVYRLQFYVATLLKFSKENLTVFSRIGDTNKLSAFSPCKPLTLVGGSLSWDELSWVTFSLHMYVNTSQSKVNVPRFSALLPKRPVYIWLLLTARPVYLRIYYYY